MPARFWVLRIILGLMCVGFAFLWGRAAGGKRISNRRSAGRSAWAVRTVVTAAALLWGTGLDAVAIAVYALAAASGIGGFLLARKPEEPPEDLTKGIFPDK
jgi:hypothetical protein